MSGQALTVLATIVGIAVGLSALGGIILRRLAPVVSLAQQLHGEPGDDVRGIAARPGILERQTATEKLVVKQAAEMAELRALMDQRDAQRTDELAEMRKLLAEAVAQLRNNGGSSVKDIVDKTYAAVTAATQ